MNKIAFISGATSGIGLATAELFAKHNIQLIICGRRRERLLELEKKLNQKVQVHVLCFDVSDREACFSAINSLPSEWRSIDYLINNAGNAHGLALAQDANLDDWEKMIDINVKGLMYVTKAILPFMLKKESGHIVNISSIAGEEVYMKGNAYCASKHAVTALSDGLRIDLNGTGIKVSTVSPGAVDTEFSTVRFKGDKSKADKVYEGFEPLYAEDIADLIHFIVSRPAHVNISDSIILPAAQSSATLIHRK
jgi:3-hydroxy acid dehydrogenase / malonic semialdehyde reductase